MATTTPFDNTNAYTNWLMDGTVGTAAKQDNAEGTAARDLVETGTLTSGTGQTTPTTDGTYSGFGANKNLKVTNANLGTWPTGAQTHEFWCKPSALPTSSGLAFLMSKQGSTNGTYIGIDNTGVLVGRFSDGGTTKDWTATGGAMTTGNWYYVAVVFVPSTSVNAYVNGSNVFSSTTGIPTSAQATTLDLFISTQHNVTGDATFSWQGDIDAYKISTVALTATDISNYYNGGAAGGGRDARALTLLGVG